ncbi:MAG: hypothetical protein DLM52_10830 [Chthoniobacterales bacterium]|nr:MAG: hypothetical protein DLM52_10830 [Chthoniobacterales bacterium]
MEYEERSVLLLQNVKTRDALDCLFRARGEYGLRPSGLRARCRRRDSGTFLKHADEPVLPEPTWFGYQKRSAAVAEQRCSCDHGSLGFASLGMTEG